MEIKYTVRRSGWVYWEIRDSEKYVANGTQSNKRKAKKAAEHALRMATKE